jgi:hypothetical protein
MRSIACILLAMTTMPAYSANVYEIEAAVDDKKFIINDKLFGAKTYCMNWDEGQRVIFMEGSPNGEGACATAALYNLDKKEKCEVWCE